MSIKWDQKELDKKIKQNENKFLISAGYLGQNQFANNSPVQTGLLKNSMSFYVDSGKNTSKENGVSRPTREKTVRMGSGIIYAASVEKRGKSSGWMSRTWDLLVSSKAFEILASKIFKI